MAVAEVARSSRDAHFETALEKLRVGVQTMATWIRGADGEGLGEGLIQIRETGIDPLEAIFATGVRRFDKSGEYKADGALSLTAWLRWKCKLSGGAAMERVEVARQLEKLPGTAAAFANGDVGFQHVAVLARTAEHVGAAAVRKEEGRLLQAAQSMDPGQFTTVAKNFEHRVDASGALAEANHAYQRRYLHIGEPQDGMVRLDGLLGAEGGATLRTALQAFMKPIKDDARTYGQRQHDALMELCRQGSGSKRNGAGPRPQLIIRASLDTLAGTKGAPAGELEGGGTLPAPTRRALEARDRQCVFPGCTRPLIWCDGHHLVWWTRGGATALPNLALVCRPHHRMVHEEGWSLQRARNQWVAEPPSKIPTRQFTRRELAGPSLTLGAGGLSETLEKTTHPVKIIDLLGIPLHGNQESSLGRLKGFDDTVVGLSRHAQLGRDCLNGLLMEAVDLDIRLIDQLREPRVRIKAHVVEHCGTRPAVGVRVVDRRDALVPKILPEATAQTHVQDLPAPADAED